MKKKTESYADMFKQKKDTNMVKLLGDEPKKKVIDFDALKDWDDVPATKPNINENYMQNSYDQYSDEEVNKRSPNIGPALDYNYNLEPVQESPTKMNVPASNNYQNKQNQAYSLQVQYLNPTQEVGDNFSVDTSNFTNRFGDIGNNVDKIELSHINHVDVTNSNKRLFGLNSNENVISQINLHKHQNTMGDRKYDVIDEREEEDGKFQYSLDDSLDKNKKSEKLDKSNFSYKIDDELNVTQNQLDDMKKELFDIGKQVKVQAKADKQINSKDMKYAKEPEKRPSYIKDEIKSGNGEIVKPKRKQSPYLRTKSKEDANGNTGSKEKPISIQTYQHNTNIMHFTPSPSNIPMMYNNISHYNNYNGNYNTAYMPYNNIPSMAQPNNMADMYMNPNPMFIQNQAQLPTGSLMPMYYPQYNTGNHYPNQEQLKPVIMDKGSTRGSAKDIKKIVQKNQIKEVELEPVKPKIKAEITYKPYTMKEYKTINDGNKIKGSGGLGANIGGKEWEEKQEKLKRAKDYAKNVTTVNKQNTANNNSIGDKSMSTIESKPVEKEVKMNINKDIIENKFLPNLEETDGASNNDDDNDSLMRFDRIIEQEITSPKVRASGAKLSDGSSHINNIRRLKQETLDSVKRSTINKEDETDFNKEPAIKKQVATSTRPRSAVKSKTKPAEKPVEQSKIYTTMHEKKPRISEIKSIVNDTSVNNISKSRAVSSKGRKAEDDNFTKNFYKNSELADLVQNHNFYKGKVEQIRNFVNKI